MRQWMVVMLVLALLVTVTYVFAEEAQKKTETKEAPQISMGHGTMMGQGMMMDKCTKEKNMMQYDSDCVCPMGMMPGTEIIATQDGGVVVMIGKKLFKYDKNLKLIGEAKIKGDFEGRQKKMMGVKEQGLKDKKYHDKEYDESTDVHTIDPYHHAPGTASTSEDVDPHTVDPYHHAPNE